MIPSANNLGNRSSTVTRGSTAPSTPSMAKDKLDALDAAGRIYWPEKEGGTPRLKWFVDELDGQPVLSAAAMSGVVKFQAAGELADIRPRAERPFNGSGRALMVGSLFRRGAVCQYQCRQSPRRRLHPRRSLE